MGLRSLSAGFEKSGESILLLGLCKECCSLQNRVQLYQSSNSNCADRYCEENKQLFIFRLCTIVLEYPDEVHMGKIVLNGGLQLKYFPY